MFMHIAPEASSYQETTSTLKFATRVNEITLGQVRPSSLLKVDNSVWLQRGYISQCMCDVQGEQAKEEKS